MLLRRDHISGGAGERKATCGRQERERSYDEATFEIAASHRKGRKRSENFAAATDGYGRDSSVLPNATVCKSRARFFCLAKRALNAGRCWGPRTASTPGHRKLPGCANPVQWGHKEFGQIGSNSVESDCVVIEIALSDEGLPLF
jgi:hypothetical protein